MAELRQHSGYEAHEAYVADSIKYLRFALSERGCKDGYWIEGDEGDKEGKICLERGYYDEAACGYQWWIYSVENGDRNDICLHDRLGAAWEHFYWRLTNEPGPYEVLAENPGHGLGDGEHNPIKVLDFAWKLKGSKLIKSYQDTYIGKLGEESRLDMQRCLMEAPDGKWHTFSTERFRKSNVSVYNHLRDAVCMEYWTRMYIIPNVFQHEKDWEALKESQIDPKKIPFWRKKPGI